MTHVEPDVRAVLVARLRAKRAGGESVTTDVRRAASALVVSERTVWRWLRQDVETSRAARRGSYELTEADLADYAAWRGNVAALHRARVRAGEPVVPLRTLQRAFATGLSPSARASMVEGSKGRRRHQVYLRWEPAARNARWETDHKELPVQVIPPRGARPCKPWVTLFLDCYSRLIIEWADDVAATYLTLQLETAARHCGVDVVDPELALLAPVAWHKRSDPGAAQLAWVTRSTALVRQVHPRST